MSVSLMGGLKIIEQSSTNFNSGTLELVIKFRHGALSSLYLLKGSTAQFVMGNSHHINIKHFTNRLKVKEGKVKLST